MIVKALIAGLLVIALAATGFLLVKRPAQPVAMPMGAHLAALLPRDAEGYATVNGPWRFSFPADHGAHPDYRTELWHFSGNLASRQGQSYGFQLTFFRIGIKPPGAPMGPSAWAARDLYWAQFALTDAAGDRFHAFERFDRAAMGLSGSEPSPVRVWVGDWVMEARGGGEDDATFYLRAAQEELRIALSLRSAKPPLDPVAAAGARGESGAPGTFHSYLMTRLVAKGTIQTGKQKHEVEGHAWLDRGWGMVPVPVGPVVWDRFLLHLDDGRELAALRLRRRDGSGEPVVTGMLVERDGSARALAQHDLTVTVVDHWSSPRDGTRFPARWRLRIPDEALEFELTPYVAGQERRMALRSWAGAVRLAGEADGRAISGSGHVESAGYGEVLHGK